MKDSKKFDFKPTKLKELSLKIQKIVEKKEQEEKKIINVMKKVFKI